MALPVMSLRAAPEHQGLLREVARAIQRDPKSALAVSNALDPLHRAAVGPFRDEAAALDFLKGRLVATLRPIEIWLFGSRGRGDHKPDSDFDLIVVLPDELGELAYDYYRVHDPVMASGIACDVVPYTASDFAADMQRPGNVAYAAAKEGRMLYRRRAQSG